VLLVYEWVEFLRSALSPVHLVRNIVERRSILSGDSYLRMIGAFWVVDYGSPGIVARDADAWPEHEMLAKKAGTWQTMKFGDKESKGDRNIRGAGGMWLVGALESELFGQKVLRQRARQLRCCQEKVRRHSGLKACSTSP